MKNRTAIYRLLTANLISGFTQGLNMIAIPWYFINIVDEGSVFGLLFAIVTFFTLFWTLYAGTLVDRFKRKNIFLAINLLGFIFLISFGLYGEFQGGLALWMVGIVFFFSILVFNIHYPAVYAFTQEVVEKEHYGKVNSMIEIQSQSASMIAGALAAFLLGGNSEKMMGLKDKLGIVINPWEIHEIFLLDGATYFLAFLLITSIKYEAITIRKFERENLIQRFKVGLNYLKNNKEILWFGAFSFSVFIVTIVEGFYLAAIYVSEYLHEDALIYTIIEIAYAFGAITSGVFIRRIFRSTQPIRAIVIIMFLISIGFLVSGLSRSNIIFILFNFILGLSNAGVRILRVTLLFEMIPNQVIGRVNGLFASYQTLMRGAFLLLFSLPFFLKGDNISYAYLLFGLFLLISIALLIIMSKKLRKGEFRSAEI
jgi:MFS family permease